MVYLFIDLVVRFLFYFLCINIDRFIYFTFSLFVRVYVALCDFVCIALLLPFVLAF